MLSQEWLAEIRALLPAVREMTEAGLAYLYLPGLKLPKGCDPQVVDALLCLQPRDGYATRLFLSVRISSKGKIGILTVSLIESGIPGHGTV
jgi:hypothetical protein